MYFTLTSIDDHRAIYFGGDQQAIGRGRVNDVYLFDFNTMVCYMGTHTVYYYYNIQFYPRRLVNLNHVRVNHGRQREVAMQPVFYVLEIISTYWYVVG